MIHIEFRNALRRLWKRPAHAALSVAVLGLGLGAMLFTLSAINGLVLQPLPFPEPERLVALGHARDGSGGVGELKSGDFLRLRQELRSIESMGSFSELTANLSLGGEQLPKRYNGVWFDAPMLGLLGVQPLLGRGFSAEDDRPGAPLTVLLGYRVWQEDFAADPGIVGRQVRANGQPATVIGVLPPGFRFPFVGEVWLPRQMQAEDGFESAVVARLAPGIGLAQARQELAGVAERLGAELAGQRDRRHLGLVPLEYRFVDDATRRLVWMMFAAGLLVLLLACINVGNLQLAQGLTRHRELALRSALGASRAGLMRELLVESLLLASLATAVGIALAHYGGRLVMDMFIAAESVPAYWIRFGVDGRLLLFAAGAALLTTVLAGLWPAAKVSRTDVQAALRDGDKGSGGGFARMVRGLVVAEIALTVVLLVGAGVFVRGLQSMLDLDVGTRADPATVLTGRVGVFPEQFPTGAEQVRFFERVVARLKQDPRVLSASAATGLPGFMGGGHEMVVAEGAAEPMGGYPQAVHARVDDDFLATYDIPLLAGRGFDGRDRADTEPVALIDRRLAERLWPGQDPVGQRLRVNPQRPEADVLTVVGVIESLHLSKLEDSVLPSFLVPLRQHDARFVTLALRTQGDAAELAQLLAEAVRAEHADVPVYWVRTQAQALRMGRVGPVILTQIFGTVGALALVLAAAGLYGVLAFAVEQRTREIGIRRAIGADHRRIVSAVGRRVFQQVGLGLGIGLLVAVPWSWLLSGPLHTTRGDDLFPFLATATLVVAVAALAGLAPLLRALRVDPMQALRYE